MLKTTDHMLKYYVAFAVTRALSIAVASRATETSASRSTRRHLAIQIESNQIIMTQTSSHIIINMYTKI